MANYKFNLTITHLYPELMNLYGDIGNIITLKKRANLRNIKIKINKIGLNDKLTTNSTDIYFLGGGQDSQQNLIAPDLIKNKKKALLADLNNNAVMLAICGGYQLLGKYYLNGNKEKSKGVGFFPIETIAPGTNVKQRAIGDIITEIIDKKTLEEIKRAYQYKIPTKLIKSLVGFENHSGRTRLLNSKQKHLNKVIYGIGDSEKQGFEGFRKKNVFGTYMHGSFLPKNPHFADLLLYLALKRKYEDNFQKLQQLDDKLEWQAHKFILARYNLNAKI